MRLLLLVFLASGFTLAPINSQNLETIAQWPLLDYALPYDRAFLDQFRPENVVPTGIEVAWHRIFISTPRLRAGVPATLSFIPRAIPPGSSPQLQAYPSWDWHSAGKGEVNCSQLISVYRSRIDRCNRMWVADSGIMTSIDDFRPVCPPKLLVFDLQTDRLVRQVVFPREVGLLGCFQAFLFNQLTVAMTSILVNHRVLRPNTLLTNLVIDDVSATTCDDVFVYLTDTAGPGILVFDGATDRSWRVLHASMFPHPDFSMYRIGNDVFELMDGIVGLSFSPRLGTLYYQPLATDRLFSVPTSALQAGPLPFGEQLPVTLVGRKSSQGLALAVDPRDDTILFAPLTETAIAAWQPQTNSQRIIAYNPEQLQFTAEIRYAERDNGNFWVMSSRFQKFFRREINTRDINIRIMRITPDEPTLKPAVLARRSDSSSLPFNFYNNTLAA